MKFITCMVGTGFTTTVVQVSGPVQPKTEVYETQ